MMTIKQMMRAVIMAATVRGEVEPLRRRSPMRVRMDRQVEQGRPLKDRKKELARILAERKAGR